MARRLTTALAVVLAVALGLVLLWPDGWVVNRAVVDVYVFFLERGMPQAVTPDHYAAALNVIAFVPFGWLGVAWLRRRPWVVVAALAAVSTLVELVQLWPALHRESSPLDVLLNVCGAAAGALLGSLATRGGRPEDLQDPGRDEPVDERGHPGADRLR